MRQVERRSGEPNRPGGEPLVGGRDEFNVRPIQRRGARQRRVTQHALRDHGSGVVTDFDRLAGQHATGGGLGADPHREPGADYDRRWNVPDRKAGGLRPGMHRNVERRLIAAHAGDLMGRQREAPHMLANARRHMENDVGGLTDRALVGRERMRRLRAIRRGHANGQAAAVAFIWTRRTQAHDDVAAGWRLDGHGLAHLEMNERRAHCCHQR